MAQIARTPNSRPEANRYRLDADITVNADGRMDGESRFAMDANIEIGAREDVAAAHPPGNSPSGCSPPPMRAASASSTPATPRTSPTPSRYAQAGRPHGVAFQDGEAYFSTPPASISNSPPTSCGYLHRRATPPRGADRRDGAGVALHAASAARLRHRSAAQGGHFANDTGRYAARYERAGSEIHVVRTLRVDRDVYQPGE